MPKQFIPNYKEFYESRWFSPADGTRAARDRASAASRCRSASTCCSTAGTRRSWSASRSARTSGCRSRPARSRRWPGRTCCSTSRPATRRSARAPYRTRPRRRPVGPLHRRLCLRRVRADRVDDRPRLRRPLPDRRERPAAGGVAPRRRRRPMRRDSYWITATSTSSGSRPTAAPRPASTTARGTCRRLSAHVPFALLDRQMPGLKRVVAGTPFVPAEGRRAAPPLRRDLRHPVRRPGQAAGAASGRHAAATSASPAGSIRRWPCWWPSRRATCSAWPPPDPRPDHARLRHDAADADQRPAP